MIHNLYFEIHSEVNLDLGIYKQLLIIMTKKKRSRKKDYGGGMKNVCGSV